MNYYERHLGDYAKDTAHLTMIEHGAYGLLLDRYYGTEAGIPADQVHRVARARTKEEKSAVDVVLEEFFQLVDGLWINRRAEEEIAKARAKITAAKENGKKGGRPKKGFSGSENETQQKPTGLFLGSENETQQKAHQAPDTSIKPSSEQSTSTTQPLSRDETATVVDSAAPPDPIHARAVELALLLRQRGAALQPSDPRIRQWAQSGVSDAKALAALETAQQQRHDSGSHQPISAGYLDAILSDVGNRSPPGGKRSGRQSRIDNYAAQAAAARGDSPYDDRATGSTIDGHAQRIA